MFLVHNSPEQAPLLAAAIAGACRLSTGWTSPAQPEVLKVLFQKLIGYDVDFNNLSSIEPIAIKSVLTTAAQRRELIELMVTIEMLCRPIPRDLQRSVDQWARELEIDDRVLLLARDLSKKSLVHATADFYRLNWIGEADPKDDPHFKKLLAHYGPSAYALTMEPDEQETKRWRPLEFCPVGSFGRTLWDFYQYNGFKFPGEVGGANAALAQHDWVHVIAGYEATAIGELEVTAFMATASKAPGAMLGFVGAVSLYETGLLGSLVTHGYSQTLSKADGTKRVAEAILLGRKCRIDPLMGVDYFDMASTPIIEIRKSWGISDARTS